MSCFGPWGAWLPLQPPVHLRPKASSPEQEAWRTGRQDRARFFGAYFLDASQRRFVPSHNRYIIVMTGGLKRYFLTGIFVLLPVAATSLVVVWLFNLLDGLASPIAQHLFGHHIP